MQSVNKIDIYKLVQNTVHAFYQKNSREVDNFKESKSNDGEWIYLHYLIDRIHVIKYGFGVDRGYLIGEVALGIGPAYFRPAAFWSYEDSERFTMEVTEDSIRHNLELLDEFWDSHPAIRR